VSGEAPAGEGVAAPYLHWLDEPAPPERTLLRRVLVRLARSGRLLACDGGDLGLSPGEQVLVDSPDGRRLGAVEGSPVVMLHEGEPLPAVVRRGAREDRRKERSLQDQAARARQIVRDEMDHHRLPMRLIDVQLTQGGKRTVVYFVAEGRVEFRELARALGRRLRCRIEMRQVGSRDAAGHLGGAGVCGLELCCTTWLQGFDPVSIRHAKSQGLEMQLDKHQGVCGRLMCCLIYEHAQYKALRRGLPKVGRTIETPAGPGRVREVNVPLRRVRVQVGRGAYETYTAEELGIAPPPDVDGAPPAEPRGASGEGQGAPPWRRGSKRRRRRRRRPGPKPEEQA